MGLVLIARSSMRQGMEKRILRRPCIPLELRQSGGHGFAMYAVQHSNGGSRCVGATIRFAMLPD